MSPAAKARADKQAAASDPAHGITMGASGLIYRTSPALPYQPGPNPQSPQFEVYG